MIYVILIVIALVLVGLLAGRSSPQRLSVNRVEFATGRGCPSPGA